jgi:hypothetical protein
MKITCARPNLVSNSASSDLLQEGWLNGLTHQSWGAGMLVIVDGDIIKGP